MYPAQMNLQNCNNLQHLCNTVVQYELSAKGAKWDVENTPKWNRLTSILDFFSVSPKKGVNKKGLFTVSLTEKAGGINHLALWVTKVKILNQF